jgi:hypothetical protein
VEEHEENVKVCYGHQVFQQPLEEKFQTQDPLGSDNFKKLKNVVTTYCNQTYITLQSQHSTGSSMPELSESEAKK